MKKNVGPHRCDHDHSPVLDAVRSVLKEPPSQESEPDWARMERNVLESAPLRTRSHPGLFMWVAAKPVAAALLLALAAFAGVTGLVVTGVIPTQISEPTITTAPVPSVSLEPLMPLIDTVDSSAIQTTIAPARTHDSISDASSILIDSADTFATTLAIEGERDTVQTIAVPQLPEVVQEIRPVLDQKRALQPSLSILRIPALSDTLSHFAGELSSICSFISRSSGIRVDCNRPIIDMTGPHRSFDHWLRNARRNKRSEVRSMVGPDPERIAIENLAAAVRSLGNRDMAHFRQITANLVRDYVGLRYGIPMDPNRANWVESLSVKIKMDEWEKRSLAEIQASYSSALGAPRPNGTEIGGIYRSLRQFEIMSRPMLFCEPAGVPGSLSEENLRMLRVYVNDGGFILFSNSVSLQQSQGVRALITEILEEKVSDSLGQRTLARLQKQDRVVTGFSFDRPRPQIFHPSTSFPMTLPFRSDVEITVFDASGKAVFYDTLKQLAEGEYVQRFKSYRWHGVDNTGAELPSGFYMYRAEAGLCRTTHPMMISRLRRLPDGQHPVFASKFSIREVPTAVRVEAEELPYGVAGVFGVQVKGSTVIMHTEGYGELGLLISGGTHDSQREAIFRWLTNVFVYAWSNRVMP